jgi:hypothetical protein
MYNVYSSCAYLKPSHNTFANIEKQRMPIVYTNKTYFLFDYLDIRRENQQSLNNLCKYKYDYFVYIIIQNCIERILMLRF